MGFPGGSNVKNPPEMGDLGSIPRLGRFPRGGDGTHSSILGWRIPIDRESLVSYSPLDHIRVRYNQATKHRTARWRM